MPIKPENAARYPANWPEIRLRIQRRAGNKCEQCGVPNHELGGRTKNGEWWRAVPRGDNGIRLQWPEPGSIAPCERNGLYEYLRIIRIVCTTAHLDHTPENCADENLRFWCQRCHLLYDAAHHGTTAYMSRREGRAVDWIDQLPNRVT